MYNKTFFHIILIPRLGISIDICIPNSKLNFTISILQYIVAGTVVVLWTLSWGSYRLPRKNSLEIEECGSGSFNNKCKVKIQHQLGPSSKTCLRQIAMGGSAPIYGHINNSLVSITITSAWLEKKNRNVWVKGSAFRRIVVHSQI